MKAILIDPTEKTVTEVDHNGNFRDIYTKIGCECFTTVAIDTKGNTLYVDDEGLLKDEPGPFFQYQGYRQPLAGKGLILGTDQGGETIPTSLTVKEVEARVSFPVVRRFR